MKPTASNSMTSEDCDKLLKRYQFNYKLVLAWIIGILMGIKLETVKEWVLLVFFSLFLWVAFDSLERQILLLQGEIEKFHAGHKEHNP